MPPFIIFGSGFLLGQLATRAYFDAKNNLKNSETHHLTDEEIEKYANILHKLLYIPPFRNYLFKKLKAHNEELNKDWDEMNEKIKVIKQRWREGPH